MFNLPLNLNEYIVNIAYEFIQTNFLEVVTKKPSCLLLLPSYFMPYPTQFKKIFTLLFLLFVSATYGQSYTMQRGLPIAEIQPPAGVNPVKLPLDNYTA